MRFYETRRGNWTTSAAEARRQAAIDGSDGVFHLVLVPTEKAELLDWLNENLGQRQVAAQTDTPPARLAPGDDAQADLAFRAELAARWDTLPLPFCLDLAALALDRARSALPPTDPSDPQRRH